MAEEFDPYIKWLGIRDPQRPPHHYALLGLALFEADREVIEHAADRQMAHLRSLAAGPQGALTQRLLNEVATARICLLNPQQKAQYDTTLRGRVQAAPAKAPAVGRPLPPTPAVPRRAAPSPMPLAVPRVETSPVRRLTARRRSLIVPALAGGAAVAVLMGVVVLLATSRPTRTGTASATRPSSPAPKKSSSRPGENPADVPPMRGAGDDKPGSPAGVAPVAANADHIGDKKPAQSAPVEDPAPPSVDHFPPTEDAPSDIAESAAELPTPAADEPPLGHPVDEALPSVESPVEPEQGEPRHDEAAVVGTKQSVPDDATLRAARDNLKEVLGDELRGATEPNARSTLAETLLAQAANAENDAAQSYILWDTARGLAEQAGNAALALQVIDDLAARYDVDGVRLAVTSMGTIAKQTKDHTSAATLLDVIMLVLNDAVTLDRYDDAAALLKSAATAARNSRAVGLRDQVGELSAELQKLTREWRTAERALAALETDPTDAKANLAAGEFYCFVKENWKHGLPLLTKGSDLKLAELAQRELSGPAQPDEQFDLAEDWWDAGAKAAGKRSAAIQNHATTWYRRAVGALDGVRRTKAQARIDGPDAITVFLADTEPAKKDLWNEEVWTLSGRNPLEQDGIRLLHSIMMHPPWPGMSRVLWAIPGGQDVFLSEVSINADVVATTPLVFHLLLDGVEVWKSQPITTAADRTPVRVELGRAKAVELVVECPGNHTGCHAIWIMPRLARLTPAGWLDQRFGSNVQIPTRSGANKQ